MIYNFKDTTRVGIFIAALLISMGAPAMAIEEPSYRVLETQGDFELRKYSPYIVAETYVQGDFEAVGSEGFRRLADYIGGKNQKKESISMTAPVSQDPASEKIAMTAPVSQARENGRWRIAFMMPSAYTMDTLPIPDDERIALREEKEKTVAVIRYSGTWGKKRYEEHATKLIEWISKKDWKIIGAAIWARYNPPFVPWFMRRNEILIPVQSQ
ncbi:putative heme-binding protein [Desulfosarcina variabilis str. Montpellier]|uniref:SOUL family heme-binding protein n=1 Tax=Desulfosarcina variabilis TaxID=2300 RepID=UPI003AFA40DE